MPNDEKQSSRNIGFLRRLAGRSQENIDSLYKSTYYADPSNRKQLQALKTDISDSIKTIMSNNNDSIGAPNISKLYERLYMKSQNDSEVIADFEKLFGDNEYINNLTNSYLDNRWVKIFDNEIDEVLKYMPKLLEAIHTMRDNVLSSDSFSKDYLNIESALGISKVDQEQAARNMEILKRKYKLIDNTKEWFDEISKYGEVFIYCVPCDVAIQRLMDTKKSASAMHITTKLNEGSMIIEHADTGEVSKLSIEKDTSSFLANLDINIELENGIIRSIVESEKIARDKKQTVLGKSITEQYFAESGIEYSEGQLTPLHETSYPTEMPSVFDHDINSGAKLPTHHKFDKTIDDDLELPDDLNDASEGLVNTQNRNKKIKKMNGCIVKKLRREQVTPLVIDDVCLGYYYFEFDNKRMLWDEKSMTPGTINTVGGLLTNTGSDEIDIIRRREELIMNIASQLADKIDHTFIDANQDLKNEIYHILKYNDDFCNAAMTQNTVRVSYIPPEDIHHMFFKRDENTGRGISDLAMSLIPAKLWVAIYITNCLAVMTRGNDKRVYYVRQTVETNISKTLLKTINEIKKSNFGIRQIENINSVLNLTGRFNDYIIPRGPDGQSPIEFEVMQGQQVEIKTELLNLLEESSINPTEVPIDAIQNRMSQDFAIQLTMTNTKFLRSIYSKQDITENFLNPFLTKLYDIEFGTTDIVKLTLPPPLFINVTNTNQLIVNTNDFAENVANILFGQNQQDENEAIVRDAFLKEYKLYYLSSYLRRDIIEDILNKARQEPTKRVVANPEAIDSDES